jgi:hypothetical protein
LLKPGTVTLQYPARSPLLKPGTIATAVTGTIAVA